MDTTALRDAYAGLFEAAARPGLGDAADGGWNADEVLAHLLSVDAAIAAVTLGVVSGSRPAFDNRICLDPWNLHRIIAEHSGRAELADHVRCQAAIVCDLADRLSPGDAAVLVPSILFSGGDLTVDQPIPLAGLIEGLAANHVPVHAQQLRDLG